MSCLPSGSSVEMNRSALDPALERMLANTCQEPACLGMITWHGRRHMILHQAERVPVFTTTYLAGFGRHLCFRLSSHCLRSLLSAAEAQ